MGQLTTGFILGFSMAWLAACAPKEETRQKDTRHVETVAVQAVPVSETISTTGEIRARIQSDLSFRVSGRIIARLVDVGDRVKAGQILARLDAQEQKADLQVALANLQSAEAQQTQARQAFDRQQSLFAAGVTKRAALDDAREALLTTRATVQSAQAQLDTARDTLGQTDLKADANGIITARNAEVGQVAQAAQLVFTLAHDGPRDAVINADESALIGRELEDVAKVRLLSGKDEFRAKVREVSPTIDTTTGTIRVKLALEDAPDAPLGSAVIATARYKPEAVIELPWSAMASYAGRTAVWLVDTKTSVVSLHPVEVAAYTSGRFSVQSGLSIGDIVVSNGTKFLSDGDVVSYERTAR
ncbi:efflux RND transporter periplasmic adaptor subunit [Mesorhizobium waimense]|uniref:Efflux RND transporter periplasmic adaptor subunit n=1 Tax=Mesorhizobium waimense TaxID=1300307 RepID=A0A3A5K980_9HYPH|nr:efflux RND transporter periplasmic adaptor subunit [Mesorhizobium waimense]RJT30915.1 efflux RND transporter periplasmic adaptor subunit [Mesorhizobium waimense]